MVQARSAAFAEESAEVEVLFAEAAKFGNISKRIKASLGRLDSGAQIVKDAMGPVYSNTQDLQRMNGSMIWVPRPARGWKLTYARTDIDKILAAIDKLLVQTEDKGREERILRSGLLSLDAVPIGYLTDFCPL